MSNRRRWQTERRTKPELGYSNNDISHALERGNSGGLDVSAGAESICDASRNTSSTSLGRDPSIIMSVQRRSLHTLLADELQTTLNNDYVDDESSTSCDEEQPGAYAITREDAEAAGLDWDPTDHLPESRETLDPSPMELDHERELDYNAEVNIARNTPKERNLFRTTRNVAKKWRERKCQIALGLIVVLTTATVVAAFVIMSNKGKNPDATTVTPNIPEKTSECDFSTVPAGKQIDFALQCECTNRVGEVIDSVSATYQLILKEQDLVQWLESDITMESCSTENLALLWVAADYVEAEAGGSSYSYETIRNRFVLAHLYLAWDGKGWNDSANWMTSAFECVWFGVGCDENGHIVSLSLPRNKMGGALERKLGLISSLQILDLSMNDFSLGTIPTELFTLPEIGM
jgi:hypothetical protein